MQIKNRSNLTIVATIVIVGVLMATLSTTMPIAKAQSPPPGVSTGPPVHLGNPNDLSTGPPVPNCNAIFQGNFQGPPDDTRIGCK